LRNFFIGRQVSPSRTLLDYVPFHIGDVVARTPLFDFVENKTMQFRLIRAADVIGDLGEAMLLSPSYTCVKCAMAV
jgi:hypothetical protein